jgi:NAD(P)-dependent dehydrogenase (short-subunit alcohol dehydrogenase family)
MRLAETVAMVTGGGSGIGKGIALRLAEEGAKVVVADIDAVRGEQTADACAHAGAGGVFIQTNVTDADSVRRAVDEAVRRFEGLDTLVNCAGISPVGSVTETSEEEWDRCLAIDLKSVFLTSKYAIPVMSRAGRGSIVNIAGTLGLFAGARKAAYCAAKAGVINLTRQIAFDYGPAVRANCICPGFVDTPLNAAVSEHDREGIARHLPLHRLGRAEDIADAAVYLASHESSYVTGLCLVVDGGQTLSIAARTLASGPAAR